ncbi:beta-glucuronidase-like [Lycorma delicatula]|uniref:beta-glucuronidase-like n=1 Tax=Lycorma delicatula TaxID=130591 RepID=UPI003F50EFB0
MLGHTTPFHNCIFLYIILNCLSFHVVQCVLYPYESEVRETKSLNGLWNFIIIKDRDFNINKTKFTRENITKIPVPSSFNDITTNSTIRDHVGWAVYWREFYIPKQWKRSDIRIFIYFGGVHYFSSVFVNNNFVASHKGGHIPFNVEISYSAILGLNNITVAVNNTLTNYTLPQGFVTHHSPKWHPTGFTTYQHNCDYFDYAGINRPVTLYITPTTYINDIVVQTDFENNTAYVNYEIKVEFNQSTTTCDVLLKDKESVIVSNNSKVSCSGRLEFSNIHLWWPIMSGHPPGYLYSFEVYVADDLYRLPIGIRTIKWNSSSLLINNEPVYLRGFGMHEDSDIRGRGFDNVILARDIELMKWLGINAFRTSHYPYADETLNEADSLGILVILETPGCSIDNFNDALLTEHIRILDEIIGQHKNRPSVIMWSLANEPSTNLNNSAPYFRQLVELAHNVDTTRPVTFVTSQSVEKDKAVKYMDVICVNRYNGWYQYSGRLDLIQDSVIGEITSWYNNFSKPVIITEYGAGSYIGQHKLPASMWSEEYHVFLLLEHFKAFDKLHAKGFFIGEMIWNFIDFNVPQEYFRPGRCDKGLFTRDRQPKPAAYIVKERYHKLKEKFNNYNLSIKHNELDNSCNDISVRLI